MPGLRHTPRLMPWRAWAYADAYANARLAPWHAPSIAWLVAILLRLGAVRMRRASQAHSIAVRVVGFVTENGYKYLPA